MIDRSHDLALATQARLLDIARSTVYREPQAVPASDLAVMRRIDGLHLDYPFAGSRMMRSMLVNEGIAMGRTHVGTLMRRMGIEGSVANLAGVGRGGFARWGMRASVGFQRAPLRG